MNFNHIYTIGHYNNNKYITLAKISAKYIEIIKKLDGKITKKWVLDNEVIELIDGIKSETNEDFILLSKYSGENKIIKEIAKRDTILSNLIKVIISDDVETFKKRVLNECHNKIRLLIIDMLIKNGSKKIIEYLKTLNILYYTYIQKRII